MCKSLRKEDREGGLSQFNFLHIGGAHIGRKSQPAVCPVWFGNISYLASRERAGGIFFLCLNTNCHLPAARGGRQLSVYINLWCEFFYIHLEKRKNQTMFDRE
jgi:hypothetical protein